LGAIFVFVGRPTLYGVTAGGVEGAKTALGIFRREVDVSMAQIGATKIADLGPHYMMWQDEEDLRRNRR
jgi:(S)-mandelate dehydrogenase